ncbi:MAG: hypothetical protein IK009_07680 [Bacteroidales bacterium]|nr:hypothetical protein [Bacteroidales bacterium]
MAQPEESCECMFAPRAGQWEFDLVLGQNQFFGNERDLSMTLLPNSYGQALGSTIGVSDADDQNYLITDLTQTINIGFLNTNNLANMIGVQARYFITNRIDINFMGSYNVNLQPGKDYIEGTVFGMARSNTTNAAMDPEAGFYDVGDIFAQKAILASVQNSAIGQLGSNYYFTTPNERINPYIGIYGQVKWARISAVYPSYTGQSVLTDVIDADDDPTTVDYADNVDISVFRAFGRAGQMLGFGGGLAFGVQYSLMPGLILGIEFSPVLYQYSLLHLQINGQQPYYASNHNVSVFKYPQLKLGFRF